MFVKECWYVAAWDHEVLGDTLFERTILGESILFYRTTHGEVVALANRCCHRHAPLSLGRKEGDCIRCMYHGLKYDRQGACVEIPGRNAIPSKLRLRAYPVVQKTRWIWIWMGDPAKADQTSIPNTTALKDPAWRMKPGYLNYAANHLLISDNLLDFSHLSYVHENTLGGSTEIAAARPEVERLPDGVRVTRRVTNTVPAPYQRRLGNFSGTVDRHWIYEYLIPGVLLMESAVKSSQGGSSSEPEVTLNFRSCQAITPESDRKTHYFFMQAHDFSLDDATVTESLYESVISAFNEDRRMIEAQQRLMNNSCAAEMIALPFDTALAHFRLLMQRRIESESSV